MKRGVIRLLVLAACLALLATAGGCGLEEGRYGQCGFRTAAAGGIRSRSRARYGAGTSECLFCRSSGKCGSCSHFPPPTSDWVSFLAPRAATASCLCVTPSGPGVLPRFIPWHGRLRSAGRDRGRRSDLCVLRSEDVLEGLESGFQFDADMSATVLTGGGSHTGREYDRRQGRGFVYGYHRSFCRSLSERRLGGGINVRQCRVLRIRRGHAGPDRAALDVLAFRSASVWEALQDAAQPGLQPLDPPKKKDGTGVPSLPSRMG